jgi:hypothetical protein
MPDFSGSCSAKLGSQTMMPVPGGTDHMIGVSTGSGAQSSSDANWNGAHLTNWGTADTVGGNGEQRGYFRNEHPNGDVDYGTFEAKLTMSDAGPTMTGTWRFTDGTGKLAKITGNGVFNGKQTSLTGSEMTWSGSYSLG